MVMRLKFQHLKLMTIVLDEKLNGPFILKVDVKEPKLMLFVEQQKL